MPKKPKPNKKTEPKKISKWIGSVNQTGNKLGSRFVYGSANLKIQLTGG